MPWGLQADRDPRCRLCISRRGERAAMAGAADATIMRWDARLPLDAVRARACRAGADGLGHRRDDLDRPLGVLAAGRGAADATAADNGGRTDRVRRAVAVPVAAQLAVFGTGRDRRGLRDDADGAPARHRARRFRQAVGGARRRGWLSRRAGVGKASASPSWRARPGRGCCPGPAPAIPPAGSSALRRAGVSTARTAAAWHWSGPKRGCRWRATRSMPSSRRCRPGSPVAARSRWPTASTTGATARSRCGWTRTASSPRAPTSVAATARGCRVRFREGARRRDFGRGR